MSEEEKIKKLLAERRKKAKTPRKYSDPDMPTLKDQASSPTVDSDLKVMEQIMGFEPSTFETMDYAMFNWVNDEMNIFATTNKGWKKTPVIWVSGERSWQIKDHKDLRDESGALIFPIITLERQGFAKDLAKKGVFYGNVFPARDKKGGSITIAREINQDKTANFANADAQRRWVAPPVNAANLIRGPLTKNKKVVYETISIPMPSYVDVTYLISVRTEYQQQMNEILQPFSIYTGGVNYFTVQEKGHNYEAFLQSEFNSKNDVNDLKDESRIYETEITIKLLGYLVGAGKNQEQPQIVKRQNAVEVKIPRERVILGIKNPWRDGKYRS